MKLEDGTKQQNFFKSDLNQISSKRNNSEKQKMTPDNSKLLYESQEAVIKLFNNSRKRNFKYIRLCSSCS